MNEVVAAQAPTFTDAVYTIQQNALSIGRVFRVLGPDGSLVAYVKSPIMKLKDEFQIFADEAETKLLMKVQARGMIQINITYDLTKPGSDTIVGSVQKKLLKQLMRDHLELLDPQGQVIGNIDETGFAMARRIWKFLPYHWAITMGGTPVAKIDQQFTLMKKVYTLDLSANAGRVDPLSAIGTVLILIHEMAKKKK